MLPDHQDLKAPKTVEIKGVVIAAHGSFGFLDTGKDRAFIPPPLMKSFLPGDTLLADVADSEKGKVVTAAKVLTHAVDLIGIVREGRKLQVLNKGAPFLVPMRMCHMTMPGDLVTSSSYRHTQELPFNAVRPNHIFDNFGPATDRADAPWVIAKTMHKTRDIDAQFGPESFSLGTAQGIEAPESAIGIPFVTIDGEDTTDMDDALFASKTSSGDIELFIAIADPSSNVKEGSDLDLAAREAGFTTYLPGKAAHMLPISLSSDAASLVQGQVRSAIVCKILVGRGGEIKTASFSLKSICSVAKLSYSAVTALLTDASSELAKSCPLGVAPSLYALDEVAERLGRARASRCVDLQMSDEFEMEVADFELKNVYLKARGKADLLVQECMIAANTAFAQMMIEHNLPCIFRVQPGVRPDKLEELIEFAIELGFGSTVTAIHDQDYVRAVFKAIITDFPEASGKLSTFLEKSRYQTEPAEHFMMGLPAYATFTSPIRKYPDLVNHRSIKAFLLGRPNHVIANELCEHINEAQKSTNAAVAYVRRALYARKYADKIGHQVEAWVRSVSLGVIMVELLESGAVASFSRAAMSSVKNEGSLSACGLKILQANESLAFEVGQTIFVKITETDAITGTITCDPVI